MKADEVERTLLTIVDCLNRQKRKECKRNCIRCEVGLSGDQVIEALETSIKAVNYLKLRVNESKK